MNQSVSIVFSRVVADVQANQTTQSRLVLFEHEIPIYEVVFGIANVEIVKDRLGREGPMMDRKGHPIAYSLASEWERLMYRPHMVTTETSSDKVPAPLVVFPRGVRDLIDFYERLRKDDPFPEIATNIVEDPDEVPDEVVVAEDPGGKVVDLDAPEDRRGIVKAMLDKAGVEYNTRTPTPKLEELVAELGLEQPAQEAAEA